MIEDKRSALLTDDAAVHSQLLVLVLNSKVDIALS